MSQLGLCSLAIVRAMAIGVSMLMVGLPVLAQAGPATRDTTCPQELEPLVKLMLRDLPSYANRAAQKAIVHDRTGQLRTSILVAGRPEFEPLPLLAEADAPPAVESGLYQVFFTTLERQYLTDRLAQVQQYHWLFLVRSSGGWRLAMLFSQTGYPVTGGVAAPPRESTHSVIGQGITTWLRDCRAGMIVAMPDHPDR